MSLLDSENMLFKLKTAQCAVRGILQQRAHTYRSCWQGYSELLGMGIFMHNVLTITPLPPLRIILLEDETHVSPFGSFGLTHCCLSWGCYSCVTAQWCKECSDPLLWSSNNSVALLWCSQKSCLWIFNWVKVKNFQTTKCKKWKINNMQNDTFMNNAYYINGF